MTMASWLGREAAPATRSPALQGPFQLEPDFFHFFGAGVFAARPEKAAQAVFSFSGDDVDVQVGNALAHPVVDGDERSFGAERLLDGLREALSGGEQRCDFFRRDVGQNFSVLPGDEKAMARKQRPMVEESQQLLILEDDRGRVSSVDNPAK